jgi:hypothetical protein
MAKRDITKPYLYVFEAAGRWHVYQMNTMQGYRELTVQDSKGDTVEYTTWAEAMQYANAYIEVTSRIERTVPGYAALRAKYAV